MEQSPHWAEILPPATKGWPYGHPPVELGKVGQLGWKVLRQDLPMPLAVLCQSALQHNAAWMRDFTRSFGVELAPHGKTTMAPRLFAQQLADGAWGLTFATVHQLGVAIRYGARRLILANQVVGPDDIAQLARWLQDMPELELHVLVDSEAGLKKLENGLVNVPKRLNVLLEIGVSGGRTGVRSGSDALALARTIAASSVVSLSGIETYEGLRVTGDDASDTRVVQALLANVRAVALACDQENLWGRDEIILSAGGSAYFDIVARELPTSLSRPVRVVLRSGCYVSHDAAFYNRLFGALQARSGVQWREREGLREALEVWTRVQSCPEPGLAILSIGKRDASHDIDLPIPKWYFRPEAHDEPAPAPKSWRIRKLNDQHAYLEFAEEGIAPAIGDLIGCGISHPCTTFDKWQWMPVVDDRYNVVDAIRTFF
ncbi:putative serine dehydratase domain protein (plasmid) [Burkholderia pseudomallei]|uniref:Serine dehydratase domain protein n=1 Tax=Burkholderia pseudomallei TaxID=28450 RepID=A0AA40MFB7_BURPE|nr:amino acid deaminase [Burkholderia pseudomallei]AIV73757.1 putative serine dehydratase domain protein [Burkholderia pseudomallei]KGD54747.1 putative D-serine deaminase (D-serine dehydratase) protein [Burkholderia pseudomallei]KGS74164.1 putative serine dehydratase domain protein [Burkholderia pseudomallei MSHR5596]KGW80301.1 putative serine dehydratase domain protein [Burkholderia pseudomallei MSHR2990]KGX17053.1 putative serine dehydratase domain protein [Burkholderia pseudomallei]